MGLTDSGLVVLLVLLVGGLLVLAMVVGAWIQRARPCPHCGQEAAAAPAGYPRVNRVGRTAHRPAQPVARGWRPPGRLPVMPPHEWPVDNGKGGGVRR